MDKLLPCPFCGGEATLFTTDEIGYLGNDRFTVKCNSCFCGTGHYADTERAYENWNRRAQPENKPCTDCAGIMYRQTNSGKIVPADQLCTEKITPPCFQPDGDGCAYQTYGEGNEPIEKCQECPLCYSDKVRYVTNKPLTKGGSDETK